MPITPNTTFVSGAILTAAQQNRFPRGVVALTNNATQTITAGVLVGLNTTYTFEAARNYRISTANTWAFTGNILLAMSISGVGQVQRYFDPRFATRAGIDVNCQGMWCGAVAAGSKTVSIVLQILSGTCTNSASATEPNQLIIEDIGTA